jgi:hypothetical protein
MEGVVTFILWFALGLAAFGLCLAFGFIMSAICRSDLSYEQNAFVAEEKVVALTEAYESLEAKVLQMKECVNRLIAMVGPDDDDDYDDDDDDYCPSACCNRLNCCEDDDDDDEDEEVDWDFDDDDDEEDDDYGDEECEDEEEEFEGVLSDPTAVAKAFGATTLNTEYAPQCTATHNAQWHWNQFLTQVKEREQIRVRILDELVAEAQADGLYDSPAKVEVGNQTGPPQPNKSFGGDR